MTSTLQPISSSNASINPALCKVARETVASSIIIGSRIATGVTAPDYPTFNSTSNKVVIAPSSLTFRANAPLGW